MWTGRNWVLIILGSFSVAVMFHTVIISDGWQDRKKLRLDLQAVETENQEITAEVERLRSQIDAHHRRPEVQERVVRDELGYIKAGEIVLEIGASE